MKHSNTLAIASLVLLPLVWLLPSVFGDRDFVPYDVAQYPPTSLTKTAAEIQAARDTSNYDVTEVPVWFLPELEFAGNELAAGRLPTWNPHARTGAPLHAHGLIGVLYPPNWVAMFASEPVHRLGLVCWINLALAGLLAFGLFRQLGLAILPAWIGAALFQLSGPMAANGFFWMRLASLIWLPGVLWAMLRIAAHERARVRPIMALGATFAMTWLGGFPPFAATTTVFAGIAFAWLVVERWRTTTTQEALRLAAKLFAGLTLGALWAMPQVLPSLMFFPESARPPVPLWRDISGQAFEGYGLLGYLMPDAFGHPSAQGQLPYNSSPMQLLLNGRMLDDGKAALPNYNYTEYTVFVSTFGAVLAVIGAIASRQRHAWLARTALLLALGLALFLPGFHLLFKLPVVQNVWPFRWLAGATLFVAWLAALGCERLQQQQRPWLVAGIGSALTGLLVYWFSSGYSKADAVRYLAERHACKEQDVVNFVQGAAPFDRFELAFERFADQGLGAMLWLLGIGIVMTAIGVLKKQRLFAPTLSLLALAAIVQLACFGQTITHGTPADAQPDTEVHTFLREQADVRKSIGGYTIVRAANAPGLPKELPPGLLMHPGIRDLNFYSHADRRSLEPLLRLLAHPDLKLPEDTAERIAAKGYLTSSLPAAVLQHPWFDLMGVRYVLASEPLPGIGRRVGPRMRGTPENGGGEFFLYERNNALSRAFVTRGLTVVDSDEEVLAGLTATTFRPDERAFIVREDLNGPEPKVSRMRRPVTFLRNDPTFVQLSVPIGDACGLVFTDTYLPGWTASIDGVEVPMHRCNHSQRLVVLPTNNCRITFEYHAPGLTAGLLMAGFATVLLIAAGLLIRRRARTQANA